jgi:hypothetical protein
VLGDGPVVPCPPPPDFPVLVEVEVPVLPELPDEPEVPEVDVEVVETSFVPPVARS